MPLLFCFFLSSAVRFFFMFIENQCYSYYSCEWAGYADVYALQG